jgi:hypothetical protein
LEQAGGQGVKINHPIRYPGRPVYFKMGVYKLQPFLSFEIEQEPCDHTHHNDPKNQITVFKTQFRQILEIHTINPGQKSEGYEYGCEYGKHLHDLIDPVIYIGAVYV